MQTVDTIGIILIIVAIVIVFLAMFFWLLAYNFNFWPFTSFTAPTVPSNAVVQMGKLVTLTSTQLANAQTLVNQLVSQNCNYYADRKTIPLPSGQAAICPNS